MKKEIIHIDNISRWIEVATYAREAITAREAISRYIRSTGFAQSHLAPSEPEKGSLHGPFPISIISTSDYVPASKDEFKEVLHWFCFEYPENADYRKLKDSAARKLERLVAELPDEAYRLRKSENEKDPETGWVLSVFEEFLFLTGDTLCSVIIGED